MHFETQNKKKFKSNVPFETNFEKLKSELNYFCIDSTITDFESL